MEQCVEFGAVWGAVCGVWNSVCSSVWSVGSMSSVLSVECCVKCFTVCGVWSCVLSVEKCSVQC